MQETKEQIYVTTISSRGQVVLPAQVRRKLRLHKGTRLHIMLSQDKRGNLILEPVQPSTPSKWRGSFPQAGAALDFLEQERKKERSRGK